MGQRAFQRSAVDVYRRLDGNLYLILSYRSDPRDGGHVGYGPTQEMSPEQMKAEGLELVLHAIEDELRPLEFDPSQVHISSEDEAAAFESQYLAVSVRRDAPDALTLTPLRRVTSSSRASDLDTDLIFPLPGNPASFYEELTRAFNGAS